MVSFGTRQLLLVAAIAYVAYGMPTQNSSHAAPESAVGESDIQKPSSNHSPVDTGRDDTHHHHSHPGSTPKHTANNDTRLATVPTTASQSPVASNDTNVTLASTSSKPSQTSASGDAVLHLGKDDDTIDRTPKTRRYFFSSWLTWKEDNYLMSILIPIACGMSAALLILCSLACIGCCRRKCRARSRRKLHRNIDPKSIRKLKTADRIKLLAASSDEEF